MQVEEYLKKNQKVIYKTFLNSKEQGKLSHAYLLIGKMGTPLKEVAHYLAKSLLCDDPSPLACNSCITCLRIDDNNYPDFIVFDGSEGTIKKEAVTTIESQFDKKAFEAKGIKIYVLHLVENMTDEAVNSLLKFLEEPKDNVFAFLTTMNENNVLPTIVSRCQIMHLKSVDRRNVISESLLLGVNLEDAEYLSYFYNEPNLIHELTKDKEEYQYYLDAKNAISSLLDGFLTSERKGRYVMQSEVIPLVKDKQSFRFFIDMLTQVIEDTVNVRFDRQVILTATLDKIVALDKIFPHPNILLMEIIRLRGVVNLNLNIPLLLDHIANVIAKETDYGRN